MTGEKQKKDAHQRIKERFGFNIQPAMEEESFHVVLIISLQPSMQCTFKSNGARSGPVIHSRLYLGIVFAGNTVQ